MSELVELGRGLFRWTALHPDADPYARPGSPADWGPEVGSVAYAADDALVLIDPLVPEAKSRSVEQRAQRRIVERAVQLLKRDRIAARIDQGDPGRRTTLLAERATAFSFPEVRATVIGASEIEMSRDLDRCRRREVGMQSLSLDGRRIFQGQG